MTRQTLVALVAAAVLTTTVVAEPLKYDIKPKQVVPYQVAITVKTPSAVENMKGIIVFTGQKTDENTMTIGYSGGLNKTTQSTSQSRFGGPPRFGGPRGPRGPFDSTPFRGLTSTRNTLVISPSGAVKSMSGDSQLPYILGNLAMLPFDALPGNEQAKWEDANGFSITTTSGNDRFGPRRPPFFDDNEEKTKGGGGETSKYTIEKDANGLVTIAKTYNMTSPKANKDETGFEMSGTGTWTFNRKLGVSESMDYKADLSIDSGNVVLKYPITIKWDRMSDEAYAAHLKRIEDTRAELMAKAKAREDAKPKGPVPPAAMNPVFKRGTMFQLKSNVWQAARSELAKLAGSKMTGVMPEDMDMLTQVGLLRASKHAEVSALAEKIWGNWKHSFEEHASDAQREAVAKAMGEEPATRKMEEENPFVVEEESQDDDGKGQRTWADASGRFKIEAEFDAMDGTTVVLKKADGTKLRIPKDKLSEADQKLIDKLLKETVEK